MISGWRLPLTRSNLGRQGDARRVSDGRGRQTIYLDTTYPAIVKGSWIALKSPTRPMVYQVNDVADESRADFTLSARSRG